MQTDQISKFRSERIEQKQRKVAEGRSTGRCSGAKPSRSGAKQSIPEGRASSISTVCGGLSSSSTARGLGARASTRGGAWPSLPKWEIRVAEAPTPLVVVAGGLGRRRAAAGSRRGSGRSGLDALAAAPAIWTPREVGDEAAAAAMGRDGAGG
jgi:hypothetical protein